MLKFRTMVQDADKQLESLLGDNESDGLLFKIRDDPRVTPVGRILRRFSIDELPQFINVLRQEMSVVGPRPPLRREVEAYDDDVQRRLLVKPGVTGLWQVSGRSDLSWDKSVRLDLSYVDNWSMVGDILIIAKTLRAVFQRYGSLLTCSAECVTCGPWAAALRCSAVHPTTVEQDHLPPGAPWFFRKTSSVGNHQSSPGGKPHQEQTRSYDW